MYLVKGDDATLVAQALSSVLAELTDGEQSGLALEDLSSDEPDVGAIIDACLTPPFLTDRRTVVVRELGRLPAAEADRLVGYLSDPSPTTSLVLAATGAVPVRLVNAIKAAGRNVDAGTPTGKARTSWVTSRLKDAPVKLDAAAGHALGEHIGEDLGRLAGILDALAAAYGPGASVGRDQLEPFLGEAGPSAPWELTDAIDGGDAGAALSALHRMTGAGERHPLVVLSTLHRHFSAMARLDGAGIGSDAEAAELLGMRSTFPASKARAQGARLGRAGIGRAIDLIAGADLDLRGRTAVPDDALLEILVARLARLSPRRGAGGSRRPARR